MGCQSFLGYNYRIMTKRGVFKILLPVLVVVGAIASMAYEEKQATIKYQRACEEHVSQVLAGNGENDKARANECKDAKDYMPWWYVLIAWPEGMATWGLLFTLGAILWQSYEARRATDSQRNKDRARLDIRIADSGENYVLSGVKQPGEPFFWEFSFEIFQRGDTKAFNVTGAAILLIKPSNLKHPTVTENKMRRLDGLPAIIDGGESRSIVTSIASEAASDDNLEEIRTGTMTAHLFGYLRYEDVFGGKHTTRFRYLWHPGEIDSVPGVPGETYEIESAGWDKAGRKEDNYAD